MFGKGISRSASLLDAAVKYGIIDKKGAWFTYGEEKVGQGRENAKAYLESNPDVSLEIENWFAQECSLVDRQDKRQKKPKRVCPVLRLP